MESEFCKLEIFLPESHLEAVQHEETDEKQPVMSTGNYSTLKEGAINSCFLLSIGSQSLDRRPDASE